MEEKETTAAPARPGCFFCTVAGPQFSAIFERMWPEATQDHFRNSRIEFLKGIRSLLDDRIERLSRQEQKGTHVPVE